MNSTLLEELYKKEVMQTVTQEQEMWWKRNTSTVLPYKMFISAPFGNYIKRPNTISVTGTWTLTERKGLLWNVLKSLRYNKELGGWTNRLGLPNKGVMFGLENTSFSEVLSISEIERYDFNLMYYLIPENQNCSHSEMK